MTTPPLPRCHNPHPATTWRHHLLHNIGGGRWACEACTNERREA